MAVGNYNAASSRRAQIDRARRVENEHIDAIPQGEREEVRQILARKGLEGPALDRALSAITGNRRLWVDVMIAEEWGLQVDQPAPAREAVATFAAFACFGSVPLLPYLTPIGSVSDPFVVSVFLTGLAFAGVGVVKGIVTQSSVAWSGIQTLLTGGIASALAYAMGAVLRSWLEG